MHSFVQRSGSHVTQIPTAGISAAIITTVSVFERHDPSSTQLMDHAGGELIMRALFWESSSHGFLSMKRAREFSFMGNEKIYMPSKFKLL